MQEAEEEEEVEEEALVWAGRGGQKKEEGLKKKKFDILKTKTEAVSLFSPAELKLPVEKKTALTAVIAERRNSRRAEPLIRGEPQRRNQTLQGKKTGGSKASPAEEEQPGGGIARGPAGPTEPCEYQHPSGFSGATALG